MRARKRDVPDLLGMNILCELGQILDKYKGTEILSKVDSVWLKPIQVARHHVNASVRGIIRVAGKCPVWIPASSVTTIPAIVLGKQVKCESRWQW